MLAPPRALPPATIEFVLFLVPSVTSELSCLIENKEHSAILDNRISGPASMETRVPDLWSFPDHSKYSRSYQCCQYHRLRVAREHESSGRTGSYDFPANLHGDASTGSIGLLGPFTDTWELTRATTLFTRLYNSAPRPYRTIWRHLLERFI
jgi:hypothetical protein